MGMQALLSIVRTRAFCLTQRIAPTRVIRFRDRLCAGFYRPPATIPERATVLRGGATSPTW
ncbi:hypothetical protein FHS27_000585 [Rhodopirellula rubra]|uniref:Uncharacterized protein n=1 Tax=Aporhodopirellula rubra TaxID=980271 RepID=A0A7W5H458_9BACT|nr:hypothetical protein [Aporhodopirellula rubra]